METRVTEACRDLGATEQPRQFRELWLSQHKVPWGWGVWITNICQRELGPSRIIHTQVSRLELPSSTPNQGLWSRYTEKWFRKRMFRTFIMQLVSKGSFGKSSIKIFLQWFIYFPLFCLHRLVITFSHESSPRPREELRPLGAPTTVPPPPRPVNRRTAALFTDMEKFLCQKKKRKKRNGWNR